VDDSVYEKSGRNINWGECRFGSFKYWSSSFIARLVENSLLEVPYGLIETARALGATPFQIIRKVLLPEALPSLINNARSLNHAWLDILQWEEQSEPEDWDRSVISTDILVMMP
jgi:ABC-type anion transport system duplicated permease subunit